MVDSMKASETSQPSWEPLQSRSFALRPSQLALLEALRVERGLRSVGEALRLVIDAWVDREGCKP